MQVGRDFNVDGFESIVKVGHTTRAQVQKLLGEPKSTGVYINLDGERYQEWLYFYGTARAPRMQNAQLKMLQIRFDNSGILRSYNWSVSQ